jgi:hypothetical protein
MRGLHIFQAGRHEAMDGRLVAIGESDVAATAAAYDPRRHEAPVVVGHPRHDAPAYGWVERLASRDGGLYADLCDVDASFAETVRVGRYRKVSASFYAPGAASSPTPKVWALRHVGLLGAAPPAVKGLRPVELGEEDDGVATFADAVTGAPPEGRELELGRREAALFVDEPIGQGRVLPASRDLVMALLTGIADAGLISFADAVGEVSETPAAALRRFLSSLPPVVHFGELSRGDRDHGTADFVAPAGFVADAAGLELHGRASAYMQRHKVNYASAVRAVAGGRG